MRPNITIATPTPFLPIEEYCRITGTPMGTARDMAALTVQALHGKPFAGGRKLKLRARK